MTTAAAGDGRGAGAVGGVERRAKGLQEFGQQQQKQAGGCHSLLGGFFPMAKVRHAQSKVQFREATLQRANGGV